jgi:hypothetical protein
LHKEEGKHVASNGGHLGVQKEEEEEVGRIAMEFYVGKHPQLGRIEVPCKKNPTETYVL